MPPDYLVKALHISCQTRSQIDLRRAGPWKYAEDPSTDVQCVAYAIGEAPVATWCPSDQVPPEIVAYVAANLPIVAYDATFERAIWCRILAPRYGWPLPQLEQFHCSAAMAATLALPGSFEEAAAAFDLPVQKDRINGNSGEQTGLQCGPSDTVTGGIAKVAAQRAFLTALCPLVLVTPVERQIWLLDQVMNERGVTIDLDLVRRAQVIVDETKAKLDAELGQLTEGEVPATSQLEKLRAWCRKIQDLQLGTLNQGEIQKALARELDLDPKVRRALEIRLEAAKTSTAKLPSFIDRTGTGGRMRDNLVYHGASTGRWTAQGAGLQNLPARSKFRPST